jgi:hypothetical protein
LSTPLIAPTLQSLLESIRDLLGQPDPNNSYWSDAELTRYINEGVRLHSAELGSIDEGATATTTTLNIVSGQDTVALPSDFFMLKALYMVKPNSRELLVYHNNLTESYSTQGTDNSSSYSPYYYFRGNSVVLRPPPAFDAVGGLEAEYLQLPAVLQDSADQLTAQISAMFVSSVEMYGVYKAKVKESLVSGVRTDAVAKENFSDLFNQFRDLSALRSKRPTSVQPFNA